jgi:hypothetical protein
MSNKLWRLWECPQCGSRYVTPGHFEVVCGCANIHMVDITYLQAGQLRAVPDDLSELLLKSQGDDLPGSVHE